MLTERVYPFAQRRATGAHFGAGVLLAVVAIGLLAYLALSGGMSASLGVRVGRDARGRFARVGEGA